ncbi:MAG TPA: cyclic nucleotide-binding domain-containing protein [Azospira sp.]|nr:cyclic nucleotide-binding domain-containing protein [Azospira sp.]
MSNNIADLIDGLEFFQDFPYRELQTLSGYFGQMHAQAGEVVFDEGDAGSHMLILIDGKISIHKTGEGGRHLLSYEGKGRIIGEMALLDRERRSATCIAESDCELLTVNHDGLDRLAREHPALAYRFMFALARLLSKRLRRTSGVLAEHLVH